MKACHGSSNEDSQEQNPDGTQKEKQKLTAAHMLNCGKYHKHNCKTNKSQWMDQNEFCKR